MTWFYVYFLINMITLYSLLGKLDVYCLDFEIRGIVDVGALLIYLGELDIV